MNAEPLDGETIHKALGLAWHGNDHSIDAQRILDLAKAAVQWRWLLIDEISMVSAEMLARLEARCRQLIMDLSATKYGKKDAYPRSTFRWAQRYSFRRFVAATSAAWNFFRPNPMATRHRNFVQKNYL